ncbi:MAG: hypothetical protein IPH75_01125 [bacterium]|nr:hypothetical protein [bacterium]
MTNWVGLASLLIVFCLTFLAGFGCVDDGASAADLDGNTRKALERAGLSARLESARVLEFSPDSTGVTTLSVDGKIVTLAQSLRYHFADLGDSTWMRISEQVETVLGLSSQMHTHVSIRGFHQDKRGVSTQVWQIDDKSEYGELWPPYFRTVDHSDGWAYPSYRLYNLRTGRSIFNYDGEYVSVLPLDDHLAHRESYRIAGLLHRPVADEAIQAEDSLLIATVYYACVDSLFTPSRYGPEIRAYSSNSCIVGRRVSCFPIRTDL